VKAVYQKKDKKQTRFLIRYCATNCILQNNRW